MIHHPGIQKVDQLLAKGVIEPSTDDASFYSNFVVPKHIDGSYPILHLKQFDYCMHLPTFEIPILKQVQQLFQRDIIHSLLFIRIM